ncbi:MAG: ATP-dependent DNA ligase [Anaerolineae bacterium]|nr:ATP-dependent DNA ligase [Anaerolineae bacterium]
MRAFAELYTALDESNKTNDKIAALQRYFESAQPEDAAWAVYFLVGRKPRRVVIARLLAEWAAAEAGIPDWLFSESYDAVGDLAETITLILPDSNTSSDKPLHWWITERLLPLQQTPEPEQRPAILQAWRELDQQQRFVWNKLITGGFRVGVSQKLVIRALAEVSNLDPALITHRLMGNWEPTLEFFRGLLTPDVATQDLSQPYPFFLASQIDGDPAALGPLSDWQAEWKWDGIRAQVIRRQGEIFIWSRGEELVTDRYPEIRKVAESLPDGTVLDGELLPWKNGTVQPFALLQRRIGRKTLTPKMLNEVPVIFLAYDLLEYTGADWRDRPLHERRAQLEPIITSIGAPLLLSPIVQADSWDALAKLREESRDRRVEGIMLKRIDSPYRVGRQRGDWWKWKIEPYTVDAVLIYAQPGSGKRASLFTDYTFGVWDDGGNLVPFAKAYSGLTDAEIRQVDQFIRRNTLEKFGPVRTVKPELVFELAFENIQRSSRHKSGIAVRFPRMLRWRHDKPIQEADSLATIKAMLPEESV